MILRIALGLLMLAFGLGLVLGARLVPMAYVAPVVVAAGCIVLAVAVIVLATPRAPVGAVFGMSVMTVLLLVVVAAVFDAITPYRNSRIGSQSELWDPRDGAPDHFETIRFGLNDQRWRTARDLGAFRSGTDIMLIGDSMAFGMVNDADTIEALLREGLILRRPARDVTTIAVPGVGPIVYEELARIAAPLRPAWTYLLIYVDNDFTNARQYDIPAIARILYVSATLRALSGLPDLLWGLLLGEGEPPTVRGMDAAPMTIAERARALGARGYGVNPWILGIIPRMDQDLYDRFATTAAHPEVERILARIHGTLEGRMCVVLVPSKYQFLEGYRPTLNALGYRPEQPLDTGIQAALREAAERRGICVVDPHTMMAERERRERLYYSVDDHLNRAGNGAVASALIEDLRERRLIDAPPSQPQ